MREWGWQWGRHAVVDLEADLLETKNSTLRELPMREAMELVSQWALTRGLDLDAERLAIQASERQLEGAGQ